LLTTAPAQRALQHAAPLMVSLISPPPVEQPTEPPTPLPARLAPRAPATAPAPVAPMPGAAPVANAIAPPIHDAAPPAIPVPAAPVVPDVPAPLPVTPPSFDAAYLDNPAPAYPPLSRRAREEGRVVLRVLVNAAGTADVVELRTSSGSPRLDDAARDTVRRWRFAPARQGERAVAAWVFVPITFALDKRG
jgi:protein TonB